MFKRVPVLSLLTKVALTAEDHAIGDVMAAANLCHSNAGLLCLLHDRSLLFLAEATPIWPTVCRLRCQAIFAPRAIGSAALFQPERADEAGFASPFRCRVVLPIAPNPQRMGRKTERCGILGVPHAAPVHRLHMHAPERAKRNRTAVRTHAVAIASRPLGLVRLPVLRLPFRLFPARVLQIFRTLAQIPCAHQMARPPHQTCRRKIVFPTVVLRVKSASIPSRNMVRPERVVGLCPGTTRRQGILHCCGEGEMEREKSIRKRCRTRTVNRRTGERPLRDGKIKRVSPLPERRS
jgi:hypothetical protein